MKIKKLIIRDYKNVSNEILEFDTDLTTLIIGQNGLGKSNLLEAITIIFVALSNVDEHLNLSNLDGRYLSFEIDYLLRDKSINIKYGLDNTYQIKIDNDTFELKDKDGRYNNKIIDSINKDLLPDYFITYYSGQNKRLENILKKFEDNYISGLKQNKETTYLTERRKFLYLKNFHAPILMLVLKIFDGIKINGKLDHVEQVSNLFKYLNIEKIDSFSIKVNSPEWITRLFSPKITDDLKIEKRFTEFIQMYLSEEDKYDYPFWTLKSSIDRLLKCLSFSTEIINYDNSGEIKKTSDFKETIEFNDVDIDVFKESIIKYFTSPLELFYALESLVLLGMLDVQNDLKFEIKKRYYASNSKNLSYESLSEGENQLFIVLGIILITGIEETIFLLDEPDTYLNPKWQRDYINLLENFNLEDDDSHIFVTTHSPLLVQNIGGNDNYKFDLLLLHRDEDGSVKFDTKDSIIPNWRIDQVLASKYFDFVSTRPVSIDDFMVKRLEIIHSFKDFETAKLELKNYEDENGYLPTGETIIEIESLSFLKSIKK
ncbi:AAA family ATPase [Myroides odoratimimus]|uniref:AAA family ATPase n=1 Tax=Myroides odoratimimus TaxID=76832 RepID=UPI0025768E53|nr:AAA family ATPase [Myroides odoratimimus]MDM1518029.1 AAA family ATPase [Myroides odoratimimus]